MKAKRWGQGDRAVGRWQVGGSYCAKPSQARARYGTGGARRKGKNKEGHYPGRSGAMGMHDRCCISQAEVGPGLGPVEPLGVPDPGRHVTHDHSEDGMMGMGSTPHDDGDWQCSPHPI